MKATALLLNWKRPENLKIIIESLREQSVPVEIFLWNNNHEDKNEYDVDLQINPNQNLFCMPRWWMIGFASTDYVFSLDDDLMFRDSKVVEDCIKYIDETNYAIGKTGVVLGDQKLYWTSEHILCPDEHDDLPVDIIKGRFIMANKEKFKDIPIHQSMNGEGLKSPKIEDDIFISSKLGGKKVIPTFLRGRFKELTQNGTSLYGKGNHNNQRMDATLKYF